MERIKLRGFVTISVKRKGEKKPTVIVQGENLVVDAGKAWAAQRIEQSSPPALMGWFEFGESGVLTAANQTTLFAPLAPPGRLAFTSSSNSGNEVTYTRDYQHPALSSPIEIREIGIFNNATPGMGTMLSRFLTQLITLFEDDTFNLTWVLEVG